MNEFGFIANKIKSPPRLSNNQRDWRTTTGKNNIFSAHDCGRIFFNWGGTKFIKQSEQPLTSFVTVETPPSSAKESSQFIVFGSVAGVIIALLLGLVIWIFLKRKAKQRLNPPASPLIVPPLGQT